MAILYVDPWDLTEEQAANRYQKLSRRLNDRMREMQKRGVTTDAVEKYQALVNDLTEGNARLPKNINQDDARRVLDRVQNILETPGSSWRTTKEFSLRGMKTFREKYGIDFKSVKQYIDFWRSENVQKLKSNRGSMAAMEVAEMQNSDDDVLKDAAESFIEGDEIPDDEMLSALGFESERDLVKSIAERRRSYEQRQQNRKRKRNK